MTLSSTVSSAVHTCLAYAYSLLPASKAKALEALIGDLKADTREARTISFWKKHAKELLRPQSVLQLAVCPSSSCFEVVLAVWPTYDAVNTGAQQTTWRVTVCTVSSTCQDLWHRASLPQHLALPLVQSVASTRMDEGGKVKLLLHAGDYHRGIPVHMRA